MWPVDLDWQMTALFLLALTLLIFVMSLLSLLVPATAEAGLHRLSWLLPSPSSLKRSRVIGKIQPVLFRAALLFGAVLLSYLVYWRLVRVLHARGILLSYFAAPILLLVMQFIVAVATVLWLPSGELLPP